MKKLNTENSTVCSETVHFKQFYMGVFVVHIVHKQCIITNQRTDGSVMFYKLAIYNYNYYCKSHIGLW